ncbi:ADP-D-ribose binding protein [Aureococcus anophagefferens]|nr:ADP-D-ribose binding protein [Aureococcus anophagefferens]
MADSAAMREARLRRFGQQDSGDRPAPEPAPKARPETPAAPPPSPPADAALPPAPTRGRVEIVATFALEGGASLSVGQGDITKYEGGCVVNAANRGCQGGGGVDGAITRAGGRELADARRALPRPFPGTRDRCATGDAVRTGPSAGRGFGSLRARYVVHAVGPDYSEKGMSEAESDALLAATYAAAIREAARCEGVTSVALPLISSSIFRGRRALGGLLEVSVRALAAALESSPLEEAVLVAHTAAERLQLLTAADAVLDVDLTDDAAPSADVDLTDDVDVDLTGDDFAGDDFGPPAKRARVSEKKKAPAGSRGSPIDLSQGTPFEFVVDLSLDDDDGGGGDDDVVVVEPAAIQKHLKRFKARAGNAARSLSEIRRDHAREQAQLESDAKFARELEARERATEGDAALARSLAQADGDRALAKRLQRQLRDAPDEGASWTAPSPEGLLDVLADQRKGIRSWLATHARGLRVVHVEENRHARPGQPLYNRFVTAWERVQDQTVKLVFHGTAEANIGAILRNGLDPRRRSGQAHGPGEYFAGEKNSAISVAYCRGGKKMLVFAVLVDRSGLTKDSPQIVVINKPEHQLPLFVLTFAGPGDQG